MTPLCLSGAGAQLNGRAILPGNPHPQHPPFPRGLAFDSLCGNLMKVDSHRNVLPDAPGFTRERGVGGM